MRDRIDNEAHITNLFNSGQIMEVSEDELINILKHQSTGNIANTSVHPREINRTLIVTAILNQRHIDRIEARNQKLTILVIVLTVASMILSVAGLLLK